MVRVYDLCYVLIFNKKGVFLTFEGKVDSGEQTD